MIVNGLGMVNKLLTTLAASGSLQFGDAWHDLLTDL